MLFIFTLYFFSVGVNIRDIRRNSMTRKLQKLIFSKYNVLAWFSVLFLRAQKNSPSNEFSTMNLS
jgi:hypothetical protein